ncbi:hypothetical protein [Streptomyces canarius]
MAPDRVGGRPGEFGQVSLGQAAVGGGEQTEDLPFQPRNMPLPRA